MKLSLAWIFDHIDGSWQEQDVTKIINIFNQTTAEIEHSYPLVFNLSNFFLGYIKDKNKQLIFIPELNQDFIVEFPADLLNGFETERKNTAFMVKKESLGVRWATLRDFHIDKEGLMPAIQVDQSLMQGEWRKLFNTQDVILEIDNKSITHRPDMWGHRGFAREIAAFLNLRLKPEADFLKNYPIIASSDSFLQDKETGFTIENHAPAGCKKFNGLVIPVIENQPCNLFIMSRLLAVESRPINALVDLTNYVMLDWSQPVHAYDAEKITNKKVITRFAQSGEQLTLLDGNTIKLTTDDLVIADAEKPVCLAGIKGGLNDSISATTNSLFFEAANFDAATVRKAALRHKTRTDASARFEKTLDPEQAVNAIKRFLHLADAIDLKYQASPSILSLGATIPPIVIELTHDFLQRRSGLTLNVETVIDLLKRLECNVTYNKVNDCYTVSVPLFRASKDIKIKEDILEEVVRLYGFDKIPLVLPAITKKPFNTDSTMRQRKIKQFLATAAAMREQQNYAFYDEQFLQHASIQQPSVVELLNPVSENFRRLISSLVPGLLKNIKENNVHHEKLSFFELGRIWKQNEQGEVEEKKSLAGVLFAKRTFVDFYQTKHFIVQLFKMLGISAGDISWMQLVNTPAPWYKPYQSAELIVDNRTIGYVGKIEPLFLNRLDIFPDADAVIFELDLEYLLTFESKTKKFKEISRYQETFFDISVLIPLHVTVKKIEDSLQGLSSLVWRVEMIDFFEKEEWHDRRSVTFRVWLQSLEKTLEKYEVDQVWHEACKVVQALNGVLRS